MLGVKGYRCSNCLGSTATLLPPNLFFLGVVLNSTTDTPYQALVELIQKYSNNDQDRMKCVPRNTQVHDREYSPLGRGVFEDQAEGTTWFIV